MNFEDKQIEGGKTGLKGLRILHPVYGPRNNLVAFVHALKLAQISKGELEIVDVRSEEEALEHIGVRSVLERWGVLDKGSHRSDVEEIGLKVKKIVREGNKRKEIVRRIDKHTHDMMVIGVPVHKSSSGILLRDLCEHLAEHFHQQTLFIPVEGRSIVDEQTGLLSLETVLIPIADQNFYDIAINALRMLLGYFPSATPSVVGLHAGAGFPGISKVSIEGTRWIQALRSEPLIDSIQEAAHSFKADLIIMATRGRSTLLHKFTGSFTEQVVRVSPCPVLSVSV